MMTTDPCFRTVQVELLRSGQVRAYADTVREYRVTITVARRTLPETIMAVALAVTDTAHRQLKADVIPGDVNSHFRGWVETEVESEDNECTVIVVRSVDPNTD